MCSFHKKALFDDDDIDTHTHTHTHIHGCLGGRMVSVAD